MPYISMSQQDLNKYDVIKRAIRKEITAGKAAELLHLSERQIYNLKAVVKKKGAKGLIHANRGRPSNRRMPAKERDQIIKLLRQSYLDFKPTHAAEKLKELHQIQKDPKTIRQIMIDERLWKPRRQKKAKYRCARPRKEHYGEMQQFDGSYHHWFEDRGGTGELCLLAAIDDATGKITGAKFVLNEGTLPVFGFWQDYLLSQGKPRIIYLDKLRTYYNNLRPALEDEEMLTQFQRAMRQLGVELIVAHSPQAKGRVERLFKTLQDRLIKELRLKKISDIEAANAFLQQEFLPWFDSRYSVQPKEKADLHRKLSQQQRKELPAVLSRQSQRTIQNDFTVKFRKQWYQLEKVQPATIRPKERVILEERVNGCLKLRLRGKYLNYHLLSAKPQKQKSQSWIIPASQKQDQKQERKHWKPSQDHPWRKFKINPKHEISISLKT